ncbi:MAG TPA: tetratricopeptide repeat protein [Phaeodactylibacter sp.]|nr:tetratricopeptide repeat protein [Phaeodactylibacter sp.]
MKKSILFFVITLFLFSSCAPQKKFLTTDTRLPVNDTYKKTRKEKEETHLLGICNRAGLQAEPFNKWFDKNYQKYEPNPAVIAKGKSKIKGVEVLAFFGTWCGDSKRNIPRFYKVMDEMGFDEKNLKLVSLSNVKGAYKQSPSKEEKGLNIHRVPTFIFYKNGKEIGRIVEDPMTSLEVDIAQIVNGLAPTPKYATQALIHKNIQELGVKSIEKKLENYGKYVARHTKNSSELNGYGYMLLNTKKMEEAILVFKINTLAYPKDPNVFDSLGEAYLAAGNKKLAIENYKKVLELNPDHKNAKEVLEKI